MRTVSFLSLSLSLVIYQNNNLWLERKALKEKMERRGQGRNAFSTRVANYRHYLWRRRGRTKNSDCEEGRSCEEKIRDTRIFFLPRGRDAFVNCFLYGRARLARVLHWSALDLRQFASASGLFFLHPSSSSSPLLLRCGIVCIRPTMRPRRFAFP